MKEGRAIRGSPLSFCEQSGLTRMALLPENGVAPPKCADVAELADALDSGSSSRKGVEVQVLSSAPN